MVEIKVLDHLYSQLHDFLYSFFPLWNEADPVYIHLADPDVLGRETYLKEERRLFFDTLFATPAYEFEIAIESTVGQLGKYLIDSEALIKLYPGGSPIYQTASNLSRIYYEESIAYLSYLYYYSLIRPDLRKIDVFKDYPTLPHSAIQNFLLTNNILTRRRLDELDKYQPPQKTQETVSGSKGKSFEAKDRFQSPDANLILLKLKNKKFVKDEKGSYRWIKNDIESLSYLCYKFSSHLLGEESQIEVTLFCQRIQSGFNRQTIGRYARAYKSGEKKIDDNIRQEIDDFFK